MTTPTLLSPPSSQLIEQSMNLTSCRAMTALMIHPNLRQELQAKSLYQTLSDQKHVRSWVLGICNTVTLTRTVCVKLPSCHSDNSPVGTKFRRRYLAILCRLGFYLDLDIVLPLRFVSPLITLCSIGSVNGSARWIVGLFEVPENSFFTSFAVIKSSARTLGLR